uniref:Uncharacterized protein n=1 Tax=Parascaris univalens TaxID=6257 RepID=A0A915AC55_PARUN
MKRSSQVTELGVKLVPSRKPRWPPCFVITNPKRELLAAKCRTGSHKRGGTNGSSRAFTITIGILIR